MCFVYVRNTGRQAINIRSYLKAIALQINSTFLF